LFFFAATRDQLSLEPSRAEELSPYEVVNAVAGNWVALASREVDARQDHIRALRTLGTGCEAWRAHVESCSVIRLRELPKDVYLETVLDAGRFVDCLRTSASWRLAWDRSSLLLSIPDADIGHTYRMPRCIVRSPP
jgi:hypothetical protein